MEQLLNVVKAHALALIHAQAQPRFATISSVDPARGTVRVELQPEGVLTGWIPILYPWAGAGWGMVCPPAPGDQVLVLAQEGHAEHGVVVGRVFSKQQPPPAAPAGELWLVHSSGSYIKLINDGSIQIGGDLHVNGNVYDSHGPMSRLRTNYDAHIHTDSRGGLTTPPNRPDSGPMGDLDHQWGADLHFGPTGDIAVTTGSTVGQQRVLRRLLTNSLDYIWHIEYGAGLARLVGEPVTAVQIQAIIRSQIFKEPAVAQAPEPAIEVLLGSATASGDVFVQVLYVDAQTEQTQALTFTVGT